MVVFCWSFLIHRNKRVTVLVRNFPRHWGRKDGWIIGMKGAVSLATQKQSEIISKLAS